MHANNTNQQNQNSAHTMCQLKNACPVTYLKLVYKSELSNPKNIYTMKNNTGLCSDLKGVEVGL